MKIFLTFSISNLKSSWVMLLFLEYTIVAND